jgi:hypothetical protein
VYEINSKILFLADISFGRGVILDLDKYISLGRHVLFEELS